MVFLYLLLAHLLADFVFQPLSLVKWKINSRYGNVTHSLVHIITSIVLLFPFLNVKVLIVIILLGVVHGFIDQAKINISLKTDESVKYFLIDQLTHFIFLIGAGYLIVLFKTGVVPPSIAPYYENLYLIFFVILVVFFTYTIEIYRHTVLMQHQVFSRVRFKYQNMFFRVLVLSFVYIIFAAVAYMLTKLIK